mgnify:CR=1 FL=1
MDRERKIYRITLLGSAVNSVLVIFKFAAGIFGRSSAMVADAVHSLSDFVTDLIVLIFVRISSKPQDENHDYGHGKYETLASTIIGIALMVVAAAILRSGIQKTVFWFRGGELEAPGWLAFWAAVVSIGLKEWTYIFTIRAGRELDSPALKANAEHHRSDALSSMGTALGIGGAILLGRRWTILDPVASMVVALFIVKVAWDLIREGVGDLMEKSLPDDVEKEILDIVAGFPRIGEPHHLRTRRIGNRYAIEMHLRMNGKISLSEAHRYATELESAIKSRFGEKTHVGIHVEPFK